MQSCRVVVLLLYIFLYLTVTTCRSSYSQLMNLAIGRLQAGYVGEIMATNDLVGKNILTGNTLWSLQRDNAIL